MFIKRKYASPFILALIGMLLAFPSAALGGNSATLLPDETSRAMAHIDIIRSASSTIDASYFAVRDDRVGLSFLSLLADAARSGKTVRLLVDGLGTSVSKEMIEYLKSAGVQIKEFHPVSADPRSWKVPFSWLWRRSHDKLVIVDHKRMISNTENMSDQYYGSLIPRGQKRYVGRGLYLEGDVAQSTENYFDEVWKSPDAVASPRIALKDLEAAKQAKTLDYHRKLLNRFYSATQKSQARWDAIKPQPLDHVEFIHNSVSKEDKESDGVLSRLLAEIKSARRSILIETPYLIVTKRLKSAFKDAVARGVDVEIHTNSIETADHKIPGYYYSVHHDRLRKRGVKVVEYGGKETIHGKSIVIDGKKGFIGSMNINRRSVVHDLEGGIWFESKDLAARTTADIRKTAKQVPTNTAAGTCLRKILFFFMDPLSNQM